MSRRNKIRQSSKSQQLFGRNMWASKRPINTKGPRTRIIAEEPKNWDLGNAVEETENNFSTDLKILMTKLTVYHRLHYDTYAAKVEIIIKCKRYFPWNESILVKQCSVFIVNFDAQCNQKLRIEVIERNYRKVEPVKVQNCRESKVVISCILITTRNATSHSVTSKTRNAYLK